MRQCFYRGLQDVKEQKNTKFGKMGEVAIKSFLLLYCKSGDLLPRLRRQRLRRTEYPGHTFVQYYPLPKVHQSHWAKIS